MPSILQKSVLHKTRIDISEENRTKLIDFLNQSLSILIDLKLQVKQAHWNVKGMRFIALHELFDLLAKEIEVHIDTTAERATTLGGVALGTLRAVSSATILKDYPTDIVTGEDHLMALIERYGDTCHHFRDMTKHISELEDPATEDLYTEVSRSLDLRLWFLEAHIQDKV